MPEHCGLQEPASRCVTVHMRATLRLRTRGGPMPAARKCSLRDTSLVRVNRDHSWSQRTNECM